MTKETKAAASGVEGQRGLQVGWVCADGGGGRRALGRGWLGWGGTAKPPSRRWVSPCLVPACRLRDSPVDCGDPCTQPRALVAGNPAAELSFSGASRFYPASEAVVSYEKLDMLRNRMTFSFVAFYSPPGRLT